MSEREKHKAVLCLGEQKSGTLEHRGYIKKASRFGISLIYNVTVRYNFWRLVADLS